MTEEGKKKEGSVTRRDFLKGAAVGGVVGAAVSAGVAAVPTITAPPTISEEIVANYFWALDMKDIDGLMALFHEDAVLTFFGTTYEGKEAIRGSFEDIAPHLKHIAYSTVVKVAGGEATARVRWMVSRAGETIDLWGYDEFTFKKEEGIWKIIKLDIIQWPVEK